MTEVNPARPAFLKKVLAVQKAVGAIEKTKENPFFKSNYFDINALLEVVKPHLEEHGLILIQPLRTKDSENLVATHIIDSESGEELSSAINLPTELNPQKMGSAITYYRRYALQSMLALESADDDGNDAVTPTGGRTHAAVQPAPVAQPLANAPVQQQEAVQQPVQQPANQTQPAADPAAGKAWMKTADTEQHTCKSCGNIAVRSYGLSKKNAEFNMMKCTADEAHMEWLDVNPDEMVAF